MHIFYIANARMPTEKAHGIQIAKMCEAFIENGARVTLVVPNRKTVKASIREFYGLREDVPIIRLPVINIYRFGRMGFIIGSSSFMIVSFFFVVWQRIQGKKFFVYTVDMDTFSSSLLPLASRVVFTEIHNDKPAFIMQRFFFRFLRGVIAINQLLVCELKKKFIYSNAYYFVAPNGVDADLFSPRNKFEARKKLHLSNNEHMVLYVGRFLDWKGLEIIPAAAQYTKTFTRWYLVGGTADDFIRITGKKIESSMICIGSLPQKDIVWWIAAADVLVVLGTKRDKQSYYYTSPMKIFEYLLSERIIVASRTPAIGEIISENEALFYEPDSAQDLAQKICEAIEFGAAAQKHIESAMKLGRQYSWDSRAKKILKFMREVERNTSTVV